MKTPRTRKGIYYALKTKSWGEEEKQRERENEAILKRGNHLVTFCITSVELTLIFSVSQGKNYMGSIQAAESFNSAPQLTISSSLVEEQKSEHP